MRDVLVPNGTISGSGPTVTTIISIDDVTGLQAALNLHALIGTTFAPSRTAIIDAAGGIDGATGNLSDCMHVDGTSAPCGSSGSITFVDAETPAGAINGSNASFSLANTPNPAASLTLFLNGLLQDQGVRLYAGRQYDHVCNRRHTTNRRHPGGKLSPRREPSGSGLCRSADSHGRHQRGQHHFHAQPDSQS